MTSCRRASSKTFSVPLLLTSNAFSGNFSPTALNKAERWICVEIANSTCGRTQKKGKSCHASWVVVTCWKKPFENSNSNRMKRSQKGNQKRRSVVPQVGPAPAACAGAKWPRCTAQQHHSGTSGKHLQLSYRIPSHKMRSRLCRSCAPQPAFPSDGYPTRPGSGMFLFG
jgi:hypothetical protein